MISERHNWGKSSKKRTLVIMKQFHVLKFSFKSWRMSQHARYSQKCNRGAWWSNLTIRLSIVIRILIILSTAVFLNFSQLQQINISEESGKYQNYRKS